jgi:hypothetical protein
MPKTRTDSRPTALCNAIAIDVERRIVRGADVGDHVHLHAVYDGVEVLAPQTEIA